MDVPPFFPAFIIEPCKGKVKGEGRKRRKNVFGSGIQSTGMDPAGIDFGAMLRNNEFSLTAKRRHFASENEKRRNRYVPDGRSKDFAFGEIARCSITF